MPVFTCHFLPGKGEPTGLPAAPAAAQDRSTDAAPTQLAPSDLRLRGGVLPEESRAGGLGSGRDGGTAVCFFASPCLAGCPPWLDTAQPSSEVPGCSHLAEKHNVSHSAKSLSPPSALRPTQNTCPGKLPRLEGLLNP